MQKKQQTRFRTDSTVYYLKTQDCYKLNNSMLKSNITNLQFILDNKPQYSISFDKQHEKKNRFQTSSGHFHVGEDKNRFQVPCW